MKSSEGWGPARAAPAVATALVVGLSACTTSNLAAPSREPPAAAANDQLVTVERGDLESVAVVSGTVEATPEFIVSIGVPGTLALNSELSGDLAPGMVLGQVGDHDLTVEHRSIITEWLAPEGQFLAPNAPLALAKYSGYGIAITVPPDQLYRIYEAPVSARANIESGPGGVECSLAPVEASSEEGGVSPNLPVICLLPMDAELVAGLPAQVGLATGQVQDGLLIPLSAVLGSADWGKVSLADDTGGSRTVDVELGVSDGVNIEVLSGLREGDRVLARAPGLHQ